MNLKNLLLSKEEPGILIVKINRPKELNALNAEVLGELKQVFEGEARREEIRAVIITGEGPKAFVAGADISEMTEKAADQAAEFSRLGHAVMRTIETTPKPVIAAVNGYALGGGTELALACDFIFASENSVFGQPEVGLGIIPGWGGQLRLARAVGLPRAKELIFSGRKIKADEALRIGLANRVVPQDRLLMETLELAKAMSLNSSIAIAAAKKVLADVEATTDVARKVETEASAFGALFSQGDQREGMKAFAERRKPKFKGL
jgi:enoyl-CoA hydratase